MGNEQSVFVVNADDLGLSVSANDGIFRAFDEGCLTSASLAVTTGAFEQAAAGVRRRPTMGVGLHFSLSAGKAVSEAARVPLLVDDRGYLNGRFLSLAARMQGSRRTELKAQIETELEAQLAKIRDSGIVIDHLNGERHVHLIPGVFEAVAAAALRHRIGHIRLIDDVSPGYLRPADLPATVANGGWIKYLLLGGMSRRAAKLLREQNLAVDVRYASILFTGKMHEVMDRLWVRPPAGVTEIAVHPGMPGRHDAAPETGNDALAHYLRSADRRAELQACLDLAERPTSARLSTFAEAARDRRR